MKIKRFFAPDIRQAMRMVREQQGPDAVILSNRSVDGGVEIVAAQDYDEQAITRQLQDQSNQAERRQGTTAKGIMERMEAVTLRNPSDTPKPAVARQASINSQPGWNKTPGSAEHPVSKKLASTYSTGENENRNVQSEQNPELTRLHGEIKQMRRLLDTHLSGPNTRYSSLDNPIRLDCLRYFSQYGFSKKVSMDLAGHVDASDDLDIAKRKGMEALASRIPICKNNLIDSGGVIALVGPTGVGKTTTIAKLAAGFRLKHGADQVALISVDSYRIGAYEQLNIYGRILGVPVRNASTPEQLQSLLDGYGDKRLVLIDTAGMGHRDARIERQSSFLNEINTPIQSHVVISAATQYRVMKEVVDAFKGFRLGACILTKLDETAYLGSALSVAVEARLPLSFITDGQRVPEDISPAYPNILVERCFEEDAVENEASYYDGQLPQGQGFDAQAIV